MSVRILVDSSAELDKEFCEKNNIELMPNTISFGEQEFIAGETITTSEFYKKLAETKELPKTALINQFRFTEVFKDVQQKGDEMIVLVISKELSSTYQMAVMACEDVGYKGIYVLDHKTVTIAQTALVFEAIKMRSEGKSASEIANKLMQLKDKIKLYAAVSTLKYLKEGGRLSGAAAFVGTLLNVKPIIELTDGKIFSNYKCVGFKKAKSLLIDLVKKDGVDTNFPVYIAHTNNLTDAKELEETISQELTFKNGGIYEIGSVVGTHAGPGAVAVIFFKK